MIRTPLCFLLSFFALYGAEKIPPQAVIDLAIQQPDSAEFRAALASSAGSRSQIGNSGA